MSFIQRTTRYPLNVVFVIRVWLSYYLWSIFGPFFGEEAYIRVMSGFHETFARIYFERAIRYRGLLIKIGQVISSRPDIMPAEYIRVLSQLQDRIPPSSYSSIKARIEAEFSKPIEEVFPRFTPEPIASASLGQVHEAWLPDGTKVAVKIQHPGIDTVVKSDLKVLWFALLLFSMWRNINMTVLYDEFRRVLLGELNYQREAKFANLFREFFEKDNRVVSPKIYDEYSTVKVLTMEFVTGEKISDFAAREKNIERRKRVVERLVEVYAAQIFKHGFFHADPHPGNIFISDNDEIVFVDFGICSQLDANTKQGLRQIARSIIEYDVEGMVEGAKRLGIITLGEDERKTRELLLYAVAEFKDISPKEFKDSHVIAEWVNRIHQYLQEARSFQIPHKILLFLRTISILEGHLAVLDPNLNLIDVAKPFIRKFVVENKTPAQMIVDEVLDLLKTVRRLPRELDKFLQKVNREDIYVKTGDVSMSKIVAMFPAFFFAIITIILLTGIPVMIYFDKTYFIIVNSLLSPLFLFLTIRSYFRALKK